MGIEDMFTGNDKHKDKVYGKYRAICKNINDPAQVGRIKVECIEIYGKDPSPWCSPCMPYGGSNNVGTFFLPDIGAGVWISFEQGSVDSPIWDGVWFTRPNGINEVPTEAITNYGTSKIIKTKAGHIIELNDDAGGVSITEGKSGLVVTLGADGKFKIGTGTYFLALADLVANIFDNHTHNIATLISDLNAIKTAFNSHSHSSLGGSPNTTIAITSTGTEGAHPTTQMGTTINSTAAKST